MIGLNLHKVVRGVITAVHPDEECTLYQSVGQVNVKGIVKSKYSEPQSVKVNFQPLDTQALQHLERVGDTKASEQIFFIFGYGDADFSRTTSAAFTQW